MGSTLVVTQAGGSNFRRWLSGYIRGRLSDSQAAWFPKHAIHSGHLRGQPTNLAGAAGDDNQATLRLLPEKGFKLAFTIESSWVKPGDNPLTLRRVWMGNSVDIRHLEERLTREDYSTL